MRESWNEPFSSCVAGSFDVVQDEDGLPIAVARGSNGAWPGLLGLEGGDHAFPALVGRSGLIAIRHMPRKSSSETGLPPLAA